MKYRKKPVVVEAVQYTGKNQDEIIAFTNGNAVMAEVGLIQKAMTIKTSGQRCIVYEGDFVAKGAEGKLEVWPPNAFGCAHDKEPEDKPHFEQLDDIDNIIKEGEQSQVTKKVIDPMVLRSEGYLQEANRRFFHPLGLCLCVSIDDEGVYRQVNLEVLDARKDPEGYYFDFKNRDSEYLQDSITKMNNVADCEDSKRQNRLNLFGSKIENIPLFK
jgi:hypothetical protein